MELSMISGLLRSFRRPARVPGAVDVAAAQAAGDLPAAVAVDAPAQFRLLKWFAAAGFVVVMMVSALFAALLSHFVGEALLRHDATLTSEFINSLADTEILHNGNQAAEPDVS